MRPLPYIIKNTSHKQNLGFTLLELLIAISLSSIVMVVLVGGFYMVSKNWQQQEKVHDQQIDNSLIRMELEKAILGAFPYSYTSTTNNKGIYFKGDEAKVSFVSTMSPSYNNQLTIWSLISQNDGGLSIKVMSALTGDPDEILAKLINNKKQEATIVLEEYKIEFEYLEETKSGEKNWIKTWDATDKKLLPSAVRFQLKLVDNEDSRETEQIIAFILATEEQKIKSSKNLNPFSQLKSSQGGNPFAGGQPSMGGKPFAGSKASKSKNPFSIK
jgi:general secretion pathway protein J